VRWYLLLSGVTIAILALTKPIFGYVLVFLILIVGVLWILNKKSINFQRTFLTLLIALITTLPYLIYTYHVTKKVFYWSTVGGNNLYWMTSPNQLEYGDWFPDIKGDSTARPYNSYFEQHIILNHAQDFEQINRYESGPKRDAAYKKIAVNNIQAHPIKFLKNCISNMGRILFNFPYSYKNQHPETLLRLPFNGIIVLLSLFCVIPTFKNWKNVNFGIRLLLLFAFLYLGGSVLGSAETRMFTMIVPILIIWIPAILQKSIRINFSW
jgi:4-amino-4-deoxy-L-arabinose transferase-like glycosyltransferase